MQTINKKDLLIVLQNSQLVNQFDDDSICVPNKYVLNNIDIKNNDDFYRIMDILRYYMIDELPLEIYDYVKNNKVDLSDFKDFFFEELTILSNTKEENYMKECAKNDQKLMNECVKHSCLHLIKYMYEEMSINECAKNGYLNLMKYLHENGCRWHPDAYRFAAENGNLECMKYLYENGCPWNQYTCSFAASSGHLDCLKYAHENGCPWYTYTCCHAMENGHLECLKYAYENGSPINILACLKQAKTDEMREYLNSIKQKMKY